MTMEIAAEPRGVVTVKMSGVLSQRELIEAQEELTRILHARYGKARILLLAEEFEGWATEDDWGRGGDLDFLQNDQYIERMAIVGQKKWERLMLTFVGQNFRGFPIQFFPPSEMVQAREWLEQKAPAGAS